MTEEYVDVAQRQIVAAFVSIKQKADKFGFHLMQLSLDEWRNASDEWVAICGKKPQFKLVRNQQVVTVFADLDQAEVFLSGYKLRDQELKDIDDGKK